MNTVRNHLVRLQRLIRNHVSDPDFAMPDNRELVDDLVQAETAIFDIAAQLGGKLDHLLSKTTSVTIGAAGYAYSSLGTYNLPSAIRDAADIAEVRIAYGGDIDAYSDPAQQFRDLGDLQFGARIAPRFALLGPVNAGNVGRIAIYPEPEAGDIVTITYRAGHRSLVLKEDVVGTVTVSGTASTFVPLIGLIDHSENDFDNGSLEFIYNGHLITVPVNGYTGDIAALYFDATGLKIDNTGITGTLTDTPVTIDVPSDLPQALAALLPPAAFDIHDQGMLSHAVEAKVRTVLNSFPAAPVVIQPRARDRYGRPVQNSPGNNPLRTDY